MDVAELLSRKYPFGREHEASIQLLFRFFCNNLFLGQFELARASIEELYEHQDVLRESVKGLLLRVATASTDGSPMHPLSWPCFLEYKKIESDKKAVTQVQNKLEFSFLLVELGSKSSSGIIQELCGIQQQLTAAFSGECSQFIITLLTSNPTRACLLCDFIYNDQTSEGITDLHVQAIVSLVNEIQAEHTEDAMRRLYDLLCRFELPDEYSHIQPIQDVFKTIIISWTELKPIMERTSLYSALQFKKNNSLLRLLHDMEEKIEHKGEFHRFYKWRRIALDVIKDQKHFLEVILDEAKSLMPKKKYVDIVNLLNVPEYKPLLPLVFQIAWQQCTDTEQSFALIQAFSEVKDESLQSLLNQYSRVDVIEQSLNLTRDQSYKRAVLPMSLITSVQSQSVLHALLTFTDNLSDWSHQRMIQTLSARSAYALLSQIKTTDGSSDAEASELTLDQKRDIALYNSFHIINLCMEAIQHSAIVLHANKPINCTQCDGAKHRHIQHRYKDSVIERLDRVKQHLSELHPLTLRLEVMEDMYTLLFTILEDVKKKTTPERPEGKRTSELTKLEEGSEDDEWHSAREAFSPLKPIRARKGKPIHVATAASRKLDLGSSKDVSSESTAGESADEKQSAVAEEIDQTSSHSVGFICEEFIIRDIHLILKEALTDLSVAKFTMLRDEALMKLEAQLTEMTQTSVKDSTFLSRSTLLQQRVSEGLWRFQLLLQDSVSKEYGITLRRSVGALQYQDDSGYTSYEKNIHGYRIPSISAQSTPGVDHSRSLSEHSFTDGASRSSSNASAGGQRVKRKRLVLRRKQRTAAPSSVDRLNTSTISMMLASPASLLNICCKRENMVQAQQVLKIFNMEQSEEGKQVLFAQDYQELVKEIDAMDQPKPSGQHAGGITGSLDLLFIKKTAEDGLLNLADSHRAETLACSASLPTHITHIDKRNVMPSLHSHLQDSLAPAMVLLDLACVATDNTELCHRLIMSAKRLLADSAPNPKDGIMGVAGLVNSATALADLAESSDSSLLSQLLFKQSDSLALRSCLLNPSLPVDVAAIRELLIPMTELVEVSETVEKSLALWRKQGHELPGPTLLQLRQLCQTLEKHYSTEGRKNYLSELFAQVKLLHRVITENTSSAEASSVNHLSVLNDGPTLIIGRLMFEKNVQPAKLADVARQVKLDLTHVIVRSCCPPVRCKPPPEHIRDHTRVEPIQTEYRLLLNGDFEDHVDHFRPALETVTLLLTNLLALIKDVCGVSDYLDNGCAEDMVRSSKFSEFTLNCKQLQEVNLDLLKSDDEKRAFFVNLHNLLSLHAAIIFLSQIKRKIVPSYIQHVSMKQRAGYIIGQMGLCSIFELEQFVLKASSSVRQLDLSMEHPWFRYAPEFRTDTLFLMYDGTMNCVPVCPVTAQNITSCVEEAIAQYMKNAVIINNSSKLVYVPELLYTQRERLMSIDRPGSSIPLKSDPYDEIMLLRWILSHLTGKAWTDLCSVIEKFGQPKRTSSTTTEKDNTTSSEGEEDIEERAYRVILVPQSYQIGYNLYCKHNIAQCDEDGDDESDFTSSLTSSLTSSVRLTRSDTILHRAKFTISEVAVKYIHDKAPVVAMLLDIIYDDMRLPGRMDNSHFDSDSLQKDHVILANYLRQYISPLCAYLGEHMIDLDGDCLAELSKIQLPALVKATILAHKNTHSLQRAANDCLEKLCTQRMFDLALKVINHLLTLTYEQDSTWLALRDYCLVQLASEQVSKESIASIRQLKCARLQAHVVISCLHESRWTVEKCLQILPLCKRRLTDRGDNFIVPHLHRIIERMSAFHRIMMHAQAKTEISIHGCNEKMMKQLAVGWQNVADLLAHQPSAIFSLLFEAKEFLLAKNLVDGLTDISSSLKMSVYTNYITNCLDAQVPEPAALEVLEQVLAEDHTWCDELCQNVLNVVQEYNSMLTLSRFMINNLRNRTTPDRQEKITLLGIGCQALMCIEEVTRYQYRALVSQPDLIVEQLLMNSKVTCAAKVIELLKEQNLTSGSCSPKDINELLLVYSEKALSFPVVYTTVDLDSSAAAVSGTSLAVSVTATRISSPASPLASPLGRSPSLQSRRLLSSLTRITTAPANLSSMGETRSQSGVPFSEFHRRERFLVPDMPPPKQKWVPDELATSCMVCRQETFSMQVTVCDRFGIVPYVTNEFTRRHHCRRCGRVVCKSCSGRTAEISGVHVRVCDECYEYSYKRMDTDDEPKKLKEKSSGTGSPHLASTTPMYSTRQLNVSQVEWILQRDENHNKDVREEFFYEHAPSASLCTSILKLYPDNVECGKHILKLCATLSNSMRPSSDGSYNQEVDCNLVISMMKFLLFNAKVLFVRENFTDGVSLCETYDNRLDVLNLLLSAYYQDLPTLDELASIDNIRRLRDKLIEDERLPLAMKISTKFGLDTTSVWLSWGLMCLKNGNYQSAKDKFSKIMKPLSDKNVQHVPQVNVINDIISTIEAQAIEGGTSTKASLQNTLQIICSAKDLSKTIPVHTSDLHQLDENQILVQESLFYLKLYANHSMMIEYYRTHDYCQKAAQYVLDKKCSTEIFLQNLFLPCLRNGTLEHLQDQLLMIDRTLQVWNSYLTAACVYLSRHKLYHTLHHIQVFHKDFIRATMTCIQQFFLSGAKSYDDLYSRLSHLSQAHDHLQSYLNPNHWDKVPKPTVSSRNTIESSVRLTQSEAEVKSYLNSIKLQTEITKYLHQCEHLPSASKQSQGLSTLFGENQERSTLAVKIILAGKTVDDGFELAFRIIQDFQLRYLDVYTMVGKKLGSRHMFSQIKRLLDCMRSSGFCDDSLYDSVLLNSIKSADSTSASQTKDIDSLLKLFRQETLKVEGLIVTGRLKNAYLLAVKSDSREIIERIASEAERLNQISVKTICERYLRQKSQQ